MANNPWPGWSEAPFPAYLCKGLRSATTERYRDLLNEDARMYA